MIPIHDVSTFVDGETLDVPRRFRVVHAPGHTDGSSALLMDDRGILFAGDVITSWNPLTGRRGPQIMPSAMNTDSSQALDSLKALEGIKVDLTFPGHGEPWAEPLDEGVRLARLAGRS